MIVVIIAVCCNICLRELSFLLGYPFAGDLAVRNTCFVSPIDNSVDLLSKCVFISTHVSFRMRTRAFIDLLEFPIAFAIITNITHISTEYLFI